MKRRIIAALTALVMVVTMIPASAFAAEVYNADSVKALMTYAVDTSTDTVEYAKQADVEKARAAFNSLSETEKNKMRTEAGYKEVYEKFLAAENAFVIYGEQVKIITSNMAKIVPSTLEVADLSGDTAIAKARAAYEMIKKNGIVGKNATASITLTMPLPDKKYEEAVTKSIGAENFTMLDAMYEATTLNGVVGRINALEDTTDEEIAAISAATYDSQSLYKSAKDVIDGKEAAKYAPLFAGYNQYVAIKEKVDYYTTLKTDIDALITAMSSSKKGTALSLSDMVKAFEDPAKEKEFTKALSDAEALIKENGNVLVPKDYTDKTVNYANVVKLYKAVSETYADYKSLDSVKEAIDKLPSVEQIKSADPSVLLAYKKQFDSIEEEVVTKMLAGTEYETVYKAVEGALNAQMYKLKVADLADEYAKKIEALVAKLPADVTRADVELVNDILSTVIEYKGFAAKVAGGTAEVGYVGTVEEMDDTNVFTLAGYAPLKDFLKDSTLKTVLDKNDKNTLYKVVGAVNQIQSLADKDSKDITAVAEKVSKADGSTNFATINSSDSAEVAQELIKEFETAYGKLNATAKADFDKAVAEKYNLLFATVYTNIDAAKKAVDKYLADETDKDNAAKAVALMVTVSKYTELQLNNAGTLSKAYGEVKEIEALLKVDAVKNIATTGANKLTYDAYVKAKKMILDRVEYTDAPVALIEAIEALRVIKSTDTDITKFVVDGVLLSYETAYNTYSSLNPVEQGRVINAYKFDAVKAGIVEGIAKVYNEKAEEIGVVSAYLSDAQKAIVNELDAMQKQYEDYITFKTNAKTTTAYNNYYKAAKEKLDEEVTDEVVKELMAIQPLFTDANVYYSAAAKGFVVNKTSAPAIVKAGEAYNNLSDAAKKYEKAGDYMPNYLSLLLSLDDAKALMLEYATVEVSDVEFDGSAAIPAVVVKDFKGNVIDEDQYTVSYSDNTLPGTAKVIVTAKADGKYLGSVTKEFKIIAKELAKVENVKFDTDYGIVRVYFDRNADIEGIDVRYQVQYKKTTSDKWITKYPTKGLDYLTLKNLTKNGKYDVRVRAYTDSYGEERVYGEYSDVQKVYANRNGAKSGIMYKAVIKSLTTKNGSVTMTVNPVKYQTVPQGVTWKYSYKKYGSQYKTWSTAKTTKSTSYTFKNLKKGTRYVFRAQYTYVTDVDKSTAVNSNYSVYKNIVVK